MVHLEPLAARLVHVTFDWRLVTVFVDSLGALVLLCTLLSLLLQKKMRLPVKACPWRTSRLAE